MKIIYFLILGLVYCKPSSDSKQNSGVKSPGVTPQHYQGESAVETSGLQFDELFTTPDDMKDFFRELELYNETSVDDKLDLDSTEEIYICVIDQNKNYKKSVFKFNQASIKWKNFLDRNEVSNSECVNKLFFPTIATGEITACKNEFCYRSIDCDVSDDGSSCQRFLIIDYQPL